MILSKLSRQSWSGGRVVVLHYGWNLRSIRSVCSKVQKEGRNKEVSRRRAKAVGIIRGLRGSQHFISARGHLGSATEFSALSLRMWDVNSSRKLMGWRWTHDWEKWDKIRNHQEENQNFSCHTHISQVCLHRQLLTASALSFTTNYSTQAFLTRCHIQSTLSDIFIIDVLSQKHVQI